MSQFSEPVNLSDPKQQAIEWLVLLRSDEMSDDELCAFADWLALDPINSEAFTSAEILYDQMTMVAIDASGKNKDVTDCPSLQARTTLDKKNKVSSNRYYRFWMPSLAIAACCLLTVLFFPQQLLHLLDKLSSDYYTQTGELREIELSDGSRLLLNTNSAVSVDYSKTIRKVTLHRGQVRFSVAKDFSRPFKVFVANLNVRALGTVFQIYRAGDDEVKITVQEHAIAVSMDAGFKNSSQHNHPVTVQTGQQLHFQPSNLLPKPQSIELEHATAWQQQRLIINDKTLGDLIVELDRYRNGHIFVSDDSLKNLRISGVFSLDNPDAILDTVCKVLELKETHLGTWSLLHR